MQSNIVSLVSLFIALVAVVVAVWQVRMSDRSSELSNALPIVSEIMHEWRSASFRADIVQLLDHRLSDADKRGHNYIFSKRKERTYLERAYRICYFFDYVGVLVSLDIISDELVISMMGTWIVQIWQVLEPFIERERKHRIDTYPPGVPPGFLVYFEHIVTRVLDLGGQRAAVQIQRRTGLRRLTRPLAGTADGTGQFPVAPGRVEISEHSRLRWPVPQISVWHKFAGIKRRFPNRS